MCDVLCVLVLFAQLKKKVTCNFTKSNTPPWVFFTFFELQKWYQIAQRITYVQLVRMIIRNCKINIVAVLASITFTPLVFCVHVIWLNYILLTASVVFSINFQQEAKSFKLLIRSNSEFTNFMTTNKYISFYL